ncbi:MAG: hypothetical protein IJR14_10025 [Synergistaceae bacterium]|nr:hypothetical protein [Synergistaceae bacterium]
MMIQRDTLRMWFRESREDAVRAARSLAYSLPDQGGPGERAKQAEARERLW